MNQNDIVNILMSKCAGNPLANNAMQLMQKGDMRGLEQMAINLCKERGTTPEEVMKQVKQRFGI